MKFLKYVLALFFVFILFLLYAHFIGRTRFKVETLTIQSEKLPVNFAGLRIVQLSDLHIKTLTNYERKIAQKVNSLKPDVIVITGDFLKHRDDFEGENARTILPTTIREIRSFLDMLHAPNGILLCRGNNDFSNDKEISDIFLKSMQESNATILVNKTSTIEIDSQRIHIMGVDYPGFSLWEANEFTVFKNDSNYCLASGFSFENSYSHVLLKDERERWNNYTLAGRFLQAEPDKGGIGITFYSQFDRGYDRFYRLRRLAGWSKFVLSPHGVKQLDGVTAFDFDMPPHQWVRFKVSCAAEEGGNRIRVKLWPENQQEPLAWQADAVDTTAQLTGGTIGVWSHGRDAHHFDDFCVGNSGDTLFFEDFQDGDSFGWVDFNFEGKAVPWLTKSIPDSEYKILLAHAPDLVPWADSAGVDLQLSGHTHGGQVKLPIIGPVFVGTKMGRYYVEGLFQYGNTTLYINRGLGTVMLPIRFLSRPEITVIDLIGR